jgi:hypothetical protein
LTWNQSKMTCEVVSNHYSSFDWVWLEKLIAGTCFSCTNEKRTQAL